VNDCVNAEVRDALPDLMHGRLSALDTVTMTAHVESCADCRAELELLRTVKTEARLAPRIDAARIAAAIPAYGAVDPLRAPAHQKSIYSRIGGLRIAVAAVMIAAAGFIAKSNDVHFGAAPRTASESAPRVVAAEPVESPSAVSPATVASAAVVTTTPAPAAQPASLSLVGSTSDLSDTDLEQLVASLDNIDTMPSAEPQSVTPIVEDMGSDDDSGQ
jgi:hypothetical protein